MTVQQDGAADRSALTSVGVDKAKIEVVKALLSVASAREAVDCSLELVIALHNQQQVLDEMKARPLNKEHRSAAIADYR